ncbi:MULTISPECIES: pyrimidine utilization protein D [unclassified Acinetobacter]|uniref:pyrimidine utilization protein D n=1 Tax=unclassified Acinetobacter TaxID=196816 RepID=UPI001C2212E0|nr:MULTISPECIES: pyrimidine utilization protein D [unclassified Acinetobacter]
MSLFIYPGAQADAPYVVLSSGLGGHASFWNPQIEALQQYFHVVSYDQEGCHQDSDLLPADYSVDHMARQILDLLINENIREFHFIGHALGGHIGMQLAIYQAKQAFKLLSLTMLNAWGELDAHTQKCFQARTSLLLNSGAEAYVRAQALFLYPPQWISTHIGQLTDVENQQLLDFPPLDNVLARIKAVQAFQLKTEHQQALKDIPVHLIANQDDFLVPYQRSQQLQQLLPHSQLSLFETGAHAATVTETGRMNQSMLQFLKAA